MGFWEIFKMALAAMRGNKLRSLLTALGIIFGVGAVIAMISIGQGASKDVSDRISSMGSNMIIVSPMRGTRLTTEDVDTLLERVPSVTNGMPYVRFSVTSKWSNETYDTTVNGVNQDYTTIMSANIATGRLFTKEEVENRERVAVVGGTVVEELFNGKSPLGEKIMLKGQSFTVIGVLESKGSSMGNDSDDVILIPVSVAQRITGSTVVSSIYFKAAGADTAALAVAHITAILNQKFNNRENTFRVTSQDELLETISSTTKTFTIMLGAIAGISLVVGGIGIMNIMLVSVTERTREIGIRKSLGAKRKHIMWQFIIESIFLSVSGGLLGIAFGIGVSRAVTVLAGWATSISVGAIMLSFLFALAVGLFFGVYPAYKAANLDPIVALRHE